MAELDFHSTHTSLSDIKAAGWRSWIGGNGWYGFRNAEGQFAVPLWVRQAVHNARLAGAAEARREINDALRGQDPDSVVPIENVLGD